MRENTLTVMVPFPELDQIVIAAGLRYCLCQALKRYAKLNYRLTLAKISTTRGYVPDFEMAVDHFCVHARKEYEVVVRSHGAQPGCASQSH